MAANTLANWPVVMKTPTVLDRLRAVLPRHLNVEKYAASVLTEVMSNQDLQKCSQTSILSCIAQTAQLGLEVGRAFHHAYLIPFNGVCTLIIGYRGLMSLAKRSGEVVMIETEVVYGADNFSWQKGLTPTLVHIPAEDRGDSLITHAYAVVTFKSGLKQFEVMSRKDIDAIRDGGRKNPVWNKFYSEMARKTVVRRLSKYLELSPEFSQAVRIDSESDELFSTNQRNDPAKTMRIAGAAAADDNKARADAEAIADAEFCRQIEEEEAAKGGQA